MENIPKEKVQKTTSVQTEFADIQVCTVCEYPDEDLLVQANTCLNSILGI